MKKKYLFIMLITMLSLASCKKDDKTVNFFTIEQDMQFGEQLKAEIVGNPTEYPILDESKYPEAYRHIRRIRDSILKSDDLNYKKTFKWEIHIIKNDTVLNAFAAPGGYMCFYTGIIKYLDNESQLAGVMAHEMAHADRRHSTDVMTKAYGFQIMLSILLGKEPGEMSKIAAQLAQGLSGLKFSRENEYEADEYAVKYLYDTSYHPKGISGFFEKLESYEGPKIRTPEFLSTHPSPDNRIEKINQTWAGLGSKVGKTYDESYNQFKASLP